MTVLSDRPVLGDRPVLSDRPVLAGLAAAVPAPRTAPEVLTVPILGDLDVATLPQVRERLDEAIERRPTRVVVELSRCEFVDATALTMLLDAHRRCARRGTQLTLAGCGPRVLRVLSLTGLRGVFDLV